MMLFFVFFFFCLLASVYTYRYVLGFLPCGVDSNSSDKSGQFNLGASASAVGSDICPVHDHR